MIQPDRLKAELQTSIYVEEWSAVGRIVSRKIEFEHFR
jgi:hypothetical protein